MRPIAPGDTADALPWLVGDELLLWSAVAPAAVGSLLKRTLRDTLTFRLTPLPEREPLPTNSSLCADERLGLTVVRQRQEGDRGMTKGDRLPGRHGWKHC